MTESWHELLAAHDASRDTTRSMAPKHTPCAAVLACSDARVSPSILFDQPAGSLFVVRVAGNIVTPEVRASFDYAVTALGVRLVVVLGHTECGAVGAACAGATDSYIQPLTTAIVDRSRPQCRDANELAERNVRAVIASLGESQSPVGQAIRSGDVVIEGALYALTHDRIQSITDHINPYEAKRHQGVA